MNEKVQFRLFSMPCCGQLLCWINPRLPNYCPECGTHVYPELKTGQSTRHDEVLWLRNAPKRAYNKPDKKPVASIEVDISGKW